VSHRRKLSRGAREILHPARTVAARRQPAQAKPAGLPSTAHGDFWRPSASIAPVSARVPGLCAHVCNVHAHGIGGSHEDALGKQGYSQRFQKWRKERRQNVR